MIASLTYVFGAVLPTPGRQQADPLQPLGLLPEDLGPAQARVDDVHHHVLRRGESRNTTGDVEAEELGKLVPARGVGRLGVVQVREEGAGGGARVSGELVGCRTNDRRKDRSDCTTHVWQQAHATHRPSRQLSGGA
jgi:hypothetical protein